MTIRSVAEVGRASLITSHRELAGCSRIGTASDPEQYLSRTPATLHLDRLSGHDIEVCRRMFSRKNQTCPGQDVFLVQNAIVVGKGSAFTSGGLLIEETAQNLMAAPPFPESGVARKLPDDDELYVLLRKPGDNNFGHWLVELLPRVRSINRVGFADRVRYLVPRYPQSLQEFRRETLSALGVDPQRIIFLDDGPVLVPKLVVVSPNSIHSHAHSPSGISFVREHFLAKVMQFDREVDGVEQLYVSREHVEKRKMVNEPDVQSFFEDHGYRVIRPEEHSIWQQVALFSRAKHIVGPLGAGLTNLIWAPSGSMITQLTPNVGRDFFFWDLATVLGFSFNVVYGRVLSQADTSPHRNFILPVEDLPAVLKLAGHSHFPSAP